MIKLAECVGQCVVKEINEDYEYTTEAEYKKGNIDFCGKVENDAFIAEWEYQLKYRVKINKNVVKDKESDFKEMLELCRGMSSVMCRTTSAIEDTGLKSMKICKYSFDRKP